MTPSLLDSNRLTERLAVLARNERALLVEFLVHLAEFDARELYAAMACSSLFTYCTERLGLSESAAYRRATGARLIRAFPVIVEFLADGRLTFKRVCMLKDVLTPENHLDLLTRAMRGRERDVEALVASFRPRPDVADSIRKVPVRRLSSVDAGATGASTNLPFLAPRRVSSSAEQPADACGVSPRQHCEPGANSAAQNADEQVTFAAKVATNPAAPARRTERRMEIEATSATTFAVKMSVGPEFLDEFEQVRAALSHKFPDRNFEDVLRECFRITLDAYERRRAGGRKTDARTTAEATVNAREDVTPATFSVTPDESPLQCEQLEITDDCEASRYIPVSVRRKVWTRDGGCCAFVSADGKRCGSRHQLEFHHLKPFAKGGRSTVENLSLRCRIHNRYEAVLVFGREVMDAASAGKNTRQAPLLSPRKCGPASKSPDGLH